MQKAYVNQPSRVLLSKISAANERLVAKKSISEHITRGVLDALKEKKRRQRGKRLNLLGENDPRPQFPIQAECKRVESGRASKY